MLLVFEWTDDAHTIKEVNNRITGAELKYLVASLTDWIDDYNYGCDELKDSEEPRQDHTYTLNFYDDNHNVVQIFKFFITNNKIEAGEIFI